MIDTILKNRERCLEMMKESGYFSEWPQAHSTWHTGVSYYGYSWYQDPETNVWTLVHDGNGDVLAEDDVELYKPPTAPRFSALWVRTDDDGNVAETTTEDKTDVTGWYLFTQVE